MKLKFPIIYASLRFKRHARLASSDTHLCARYTAAQKKPVTQSKQYFCFYVAESKMEDDDMTQVQVDKMMDDYLSR